MSWTPEREKEIRERIAAATPGPWESGRSICCPDAGWVDGPNRRVCDYDAPKRTHSIDAEDAEFIAHARTDLPDALDEIARLRAELHKAEQQRDGAISDLREVCRVLDASPIETAVTAAERVAESEAQAAVMREGLEDEYLSQCEGGRWGCAGCVATGKTSSRIGAFWNDVDVFDERESIVHVPGCALHPDAGKALLERLRKAEASNAELRTAIANLLVIKRANGRWWCAGCTTHHDVETVEEIVHNAKCELHVEAAGG